MLNFLWLYVIIIYDARACIYRYVGKAHWSDENDDILTPRRPPACRAAAFIQDWEDMQTLSL